MLLLPPASWGQLYAAGFLPYDHNYGVVLDAIGLSILGCVCLAAIFFFRIAVWRANLPAILCFMVTANPALLIFAVANYEQIFGRPLAV